MEDTVKFKLLIAYDGSGYAGWQTQKVGIGVQQIIEDAMARLFQTKLRLHSSSRTDTGVHALGMVAHVSLPPKAARMTTEKMMLALNAHLPPDIRIQSVSRCPAEFHARFDATGKQYRYFVWNHRAANPLLLKQTWHVPNPLDLAAMRQAAKLLVGRHDFRSFAANRSYVTPDTVRTLYRCGIRRQGPLLTFVIEGGGFLYKMCRGLVGTLIQVGQGKIAPDEIQRILESKDRRVAGMTAPAHGLVLWKVLYSGKKEPYHPVAAGYDREIETGEDE